MARKKKKAEPTIGTAAPEIETAPPEIGTGEPSQIAAPPQGVEAATEITTPEIETPPPEIGTGEPNAPNAEPTAWDTRISSNSLWIWMKPWSLPSTETPDPPVDRRTHIERIND